jgi:hypothetical protein
MTTSFIGNFEYLGSIASLSFSVEKQPTHLTMTPTGGEIDSSTKVIVTLYDDNGNPMPGKPITLLKENAVGQVITETAVTDYLGQVPVGLDETITGSLVITSAFGVDILTTDPFAIQDPLFESSIVSGTYTIIRRDTITGGLSPISAGNKVTVTAYITRPCIPIYKYLATWNWGDGEVTEGMVSCSSDYLKVIGQHTYVAPGVYTVRLMVREDFIPVWESEFRYVTIYDASGGFVTGGGWFDSPPGACSYVPACDLDPTGRASFGFVAKYKKGTQEPSGYTEFQFKAGGLNFRSLSYDWLVIAGSKAKFKGVGTINNSGLKYGFMISAIDADLNENDAFEIDRFRIRIWSLDTEEVIYDNQVLGDLTDDADPNIEINGGSITIHPDK